MDNSRLLSPLTFVFAKKVTSFSIISYFLLVFRTMTLARIVFFAKMLRYALRQYGCTMIFLIRCIFRLSLRMWERSGLSSSPFLFSPALEHNQMSTNRPQALFGEVAWWRVRGKRRRSR